MTARSLLVPTLLTLAGTLGLGLVGLGVFLFGSVEYARVVSPDGAFAAVTTYQRYEGFIPRGPGSGSDKPGRMEIVRLSDGRSCGAVSLDMVWMSRELEWSLTATPRSASAAMSFWNLDTCAVE